MVTPVYTCSCSWYSNSIRNGTGRGAHVTMPDTPFEILVCKPCRALIHSCCASENCRCTSCRHHCTICNQSCRVVYRTSDTGILAEELRGKQACYKCYLAVTSIIPRGQGCEQCGGPTGYRNPRDPSDTYRCISCH